MICDICNGNTDKPAALLGTKDVVTSKQCWKLYLNSLLADGFLEIDSLEASLPGYVGQLASSDTPWAICEKCTLGLLNFGFNLPNPNQAPSPNGHALCSTDESLVFKVLDEAGMEKAFQAARTAAQEIIQEARKENVTDQKVRGLAGAMSPSVEISTNPDLEKKVSRNAPCPCGSGKRYKHCCGDSQFQASERHSDNSSEQAFSVKTNEVTGEFAGLDEDLINFIIGSANVPNGPDDFTSNERAGLLNLFIWLRRSNFLSTSFSTHLSPPENCDTCNRSLRNAEFFIDGRLDNQLEWGNLCPDCFIERGAGIGVGFGQLYMLAHDDWVLLAGGASEE